MKEAKKDSAVGWCRAGKENRVGDGLVSSPTTVRNPPRDNSSGSLGDSTDRTPTSSRSFGVVFERSRPQIWGGQYAVRVRAWDIVSKSMSMEDA